MKPRNLGCAKELPVTENCTPSIDILVADDEPHIARALSFIFTKEGYRVAIAADGEAAMELLASCTPRIIFLDLIMPRKNGYEVCQAVKSDQRLRDAHVIILTCKGQDLDREKGLEAGADEFMTKPFSPKEVVNRVRTLLESHGNESQG